MKKSVSRAWNSFQQLVRFFVWYGAALAALFYLLPIIGLLVEHQYETLSSVAKFFSIIGFFLVLGAWQIVNTRDRWRAVT
jgi:hypothetical protein